MYNMSEKERRELGKKGREHVLKNYGYEDYIQMWDETLTDIHERMGSWGTRKHKAWEMVELA